MTRSDLVSPFCWAPSAPGARESLGHVQCQNQKEKLSMSTSRAPDAAWKGCCLPGNLSLSSLSILSSSDTCIPVGPLISRPCNQQQLPQLQKGEMIFQLSNGPGSSVSCWMATGAPLGLPQPLGTDDQAHTGLSTRYPGLSPWDRLLICHCCGFADSLCGFPKAPH